MTAVPMGAPGQATTEPSRRRYAPIVLFAYKRADHLRRTIESLGANPEAACTEVTLYCDGARRPSDQVAVDEVRSFVMQIEGFASVRPVFRPHNLGLAKSIIAGVSEALQLHDRVIVLEDDLVLSPHFLRYMNAGLDCYAADDAVASIHGYCYPTEAPLPETFFMRGADCWGWATWARAWSHFDADGHRLLDELRARRLTRAFDLDGSFQYTAMLEDQVAGRNDSWAIRWHASCFLKAMLTLYPGRSLVENIGNDASGTHCSATAAYSQDVANADVRLGRIPLTESREAHRAFVRFFRRRQPMPLVSRASRVLRGLYQRLA